MPSICECVQCGSDVLLDDVVKAAAIPSTNGFVAILWECRECGFTGRTALRHKEWEGLNEHDEWMRREKDRIIEGFKIDLETIDDIGDLLAEWASYPGIVPIEIKPTQRCGCPKCEEKYGR